MSEGCRIDLETLVEKTTRRHTLKRGIQTALVLSAGMLYMAYTGDGGMAAPIITSGVASIPVSDCLYFHLKTLDYRQNDKSSE